VASRRTAEWSISIVEMKPAPPLAAVRDAFAGKMKLLGAAFAVSRATASGRLRVDSRWP
jgi:hypothetical protein